MKIEYKITLDKDEDEKILEWVEDYMFQALNPKFYLTSEQSQSYGQPQRSLRQIYHNKKKITGQLVEVES